MKMHKITVLLLPSLLILTGCGSKYTESQAEQMGTISGFQDYIKSNAFGYCFNEEKTTSALSDELQKKASEIIISAKYENGESDDFTNKAGKQYTSKFKALNIGYGEENGNALLLSVNCDAYLCHTYFHDTSFDWRDHGPIMNYYRINQESGKALLDLFK
jgi:hypothetical protein